MTFDAWLAYFRQNPARQAQLEDQVDWNEPCTLPIQTRRALTHSFQRFELGEQGDGSRLLKKASDAGDATYLEALRMLVAEEQRHSALFRRGLRHLGSPSLTTHWSDAAFTGLRRMLGLKTEVALFLVAETVSLQYFVALAQDAPDPVLRGIGTRILTDEIEHVRFQIDRLRVGFAGSSRFVRVSVGVIWGVVAAGAAAVLVTDHAAALRACGLRPSRYWGSAMRQFRDAAQAVLTRPSRAALGPSRWSRELTAPAPTLAGAR